ncbi:MAG: DODA-type extradiol aromatic ring-opening family dioxygenase, partial [Burkholderiales bacterium]
FMTQPIYFVSHGSPMHAIEPGGAGGIWRQIGAELQQHGSGLRAVLCITAHWETAAPTLSAAAHPPMIYDFGGFPEALYRIVYPAPGDASLAEQASALIEAAGLPSRIDPVRGFDHGTWVPLRAMFPNADVPIVQLSVQTHLGAAHHVAVGRALQPLRDAGVAIIASGHMTHNLRDWFGARSASPYSRAAMHGDCAEAFQSWVHEKLMANDIDALVDYRRVAPHAVRAHPTEEHFMPLFVALGASAQSAQRERLYAGLDGPLAMDAYRFG